MATWRVGTQQLSGYERKQIPGRPLACLHTEDEQLQGRPAQLLEQARANGSVSDIGWRVRSDGVRFWAEVTLTALRDDHSGPRGFAAVMRDITDRRRAEEAQRDHADHLAQIIDTQSAVAQEQLDNQRLMDVVVERLPVLTGASGAVVELVDGEELVYAAASGTAAPYIGLRLKADNSFSGLCVRNDQVLLTNDTELDPRVDLAATRIVNVRSMVVAPLKYEGRVVGALKVLSSRADGFRDQQIATLELMAGVLGGPLGHAQSFAERTRAEAAARASAARSACWRAESWARCQSADSGCSTSP